MQYYNEDSYQDEKHLAMKGKEKLSFTGESGKRAIVVRDFAALNLQDRKMAGQNNVCDSLHHRRYNRCSPEAIKNPAFFSECRDIDRLEWMIVHPGVTKNTSVIGGPFQSETTQ
jgi:hypothetical protein